MKLEKRIDILFSLVPRWLWFLLLVGLCLSYQEGQRMVFGTALINIFFLMVFLRVAIIWHELGHLLVGKWVGFPPKRLIMGRGHEVYRTEWGGVKVILNSYFMSGFATSAIDSTRYIRSRYALYVSGGFLFNLFLAGMLYLLFGFHPLFFTGKGGLDISSAMIASNLYLIPFTLIPYRIMYQGLRVPNDGLRLLTLPFERSAKIKELIAVNTLLEVLDLYEAKKYEEASSLLEECIEAFPEATTLYISKASIQLKKGNLEGSLEDLRNLKKNLDKNERKSVQLLLDNLFAWVYLVKGEIQLASLHASRINFYRNRDPHLRGTCGSVLIEKGETDQGIQLLLQDFNINYPNQTTIAAAIYLMLAYHKKGEAVLSQKYLDFVERNKGLLDWDTSVLFERNCKKMAMLTT